MFKWVSCILLCRVLTTYCYCGNQEAKTQTVSSYVYSQHVSGQMGQPAWLAYYQSDSASDHLSPWTGWLKKGKEIEYLERKKPDDHLRIKLTGQRALHFFQKWEHLLRSLLKWWHTLVVRCLSTSIFACLPSFALNSRQSHCAKGWTSSLETKLSESYP